MNHSLRHHFPYPNPAANMVLGQLLTNEITDKRILQAMQEVPRAAFVPEALRGAAYVDEDIQIAPGRTLIAPLTFARLLSLAAITPACRVLNIGCLTGYTTAVIAKLAGHVAGIDTDESALAEAKAHMRRLALADVDIEQVGNMARGYAKSAPYDAIVISGAVQVISEALGSQLSVGGRLVTVHNTSGASSGTDGLGKGLLVMRLDHRLQHREHFDASTSLVPGFERAASFDF